VSACNGDSGGGLVIYQDGVPLLRGIVSFGIVKNAETVTCDPEFPSIYLDLTSYMHWIVETALEWQMAYVKIVYN